MSRRRDLEPIGPSLDAFLKRIGMPTALDLTAMVDAWSEVAGEPFSAAAEPIGLQDGELTIGVKDGPTASLLKYRLGELLDRLQTHFGAEMVTLIKIRVNTRRNSL